VRRAAIALLLAVGSVSYAQSDSESAAGATRLASLRLNDPSLRSLFRSELPQISFLIGKDEKSGKIQIGDAIGANAWTLALAGPLDENKDRTEFFSDDGLGDAINIEFGFKHAFLVKHDFPKVSRELTNACLKVLSDRNCTATKIRSSSNFNEVRLTPAERAAVDAGPNAAKWMLSASAKTSRKKFEFANATTLEKDDLEKTGGSLNGGAVYIVDTAKINPALLYAVGLTLKRSSAYKDADEVQICKPASVAGAEVCRDTPLGPPTNSKKWVAQLETRQFIGETIALAPRLIYTKVDGAKAKVWSAELPIYLRNEIDSPFQGGISLRYDNKSNDFSIAFFIGALGILR
jgi:hypothetical protein